MTYHLKSKNYLELILYLVNIISYLIFYKRSWLSGTELFLFLIGSFLSLFFLVNILKFFFSKSSLLYNIILLFTTVVSLICHITHLVIGHPLEVFFVYDNFHEIFNFTSIGHVVSHFTFSTSFIFLMFLFFLIYLVIIESKKNTCIVSKFFVTKAHIVVYAFLLLFLPTKKDIFTEKTIETFLLILNENKSLTYEPPQNNKRLKVRNKGKEERKDINKKTENIDRKRLPHIFIIFFESLSYTFISKNHPVKGEYTPFLNSLLKKGINLEHFYGNSVQTSRGQFSTLCSLLPSYRKKIFKSYYKNKYECISDIFKKKGYTNIFFKAYKNINFDNTRLFMKMHSFDHVKGMSKEFISSEDKKFIWGWGLQDDVFYKKFFLYLDKVNSDKPEDSSNNKKLYFSTLTTISSHMNFDKIPKHLRYFYKEPKNKKEHYANAIYISDKYLKTFFTELYKRSYLENSLVVLLGDHSFPLGEHGHYFNESSYYEEFYRTRALFLWKDKVKNLAINIPTSQLDIAPTILNLVGLKENQSFMGTSVLGNLNKNRSIYQIQPYAGTYLGIIQWPYKYIYHLRSKKDFLYNIEKDKKEKTNLSLLSDNSKLLELFKKEVEFLKKNQRKIEMNN